MTKKSWQCNKTSLQRKVYEDAVALIPDAKMMRQEMALHTSIFNAKFEKGCQIKSVPQAVLAVENMILYGSHIKNDGMINSTKLSQFHDFCKQSCKPTGSTGGGKEQ